jgi:hypothetical protein
MFECVDHEAIIIAVTEEKNIFPAHRTIKLYHRLQSLSLLQITAGEPRFEV